MQGSKKSLHLPWHQGEGYWLCAWIAPEHRTVITALEALGAISISEGVWGLAAGPRWAERWAAMEAILAPLPASEQFSVAIIPGTQAPDAQLLSMSRKTLAEVRHIAENLWLGEALLGGRILCYFLPVMDKRGKPFGSESLARLRTESGQLISGGSIFAASKALNMEHMVDRHLHVEAIRNFVSGDYPGFLFINFIPGFIQKPDVYLDGLREAADQFGLASKRIVLELTQPESKKDRSHLKSVCEYGRNRGYAISLDDMESPDVAQLLIQDIRPDFVKLDIRLVRQALEEKGKNTIQHLVSLCHQAGAMVIAEGVETTATHQALLDIGVDLFQGYLFSPPEA